MKIISSLLVLGLLTPSAFAAVGKSHLAKSEKKVTLDQSDIVKLERFETLFRMDPKTPGLFKAMKKSALTYQQKAVPTLVKVMKDDNFSDQNRWQATMLLAQVMGAKSAAFIAKFSEHPNWMMRLASLKALLGLKQDSYHAVYSRALKDPSLIVRIQALDNISQLKIVSLAPEVWQMMYDQSNYAGDAGKRKRTSIVKSVIRTLGDLEYKKVTPILASLIQKDKYSDLADDLDYSLEKMTKKTSPDSMAERRKFWESHAKSI
ncbi:MAG: HEAT repeat domain-containing protein [Candidatus Caldatribacteriota bacterium]